MIPSFHSNHLTPHLGGRETTTSRALPLSYPHNIHARAEFALPSGASPVRRLGAPFELRVPLVHPPELAPFLRRRKLAAGGLIRFESRVYLLVSVFADPAPLQHHVDRLFHYEKEPGEVHWAFPTIPVASRPSLKKTHTVLTARFRKDALGPLWSRYGHPASVTGGMWLATLFLPGTWNAAAVFTTPDHLFLYVALF